MMANVRPRAPAREGGREFELTRKQFDWIRRFIKGQAGIDLSDAKLDLVYSRLTRRLRALGYDAFGPYLERLAQGDQAEARELVNALTTNVTSFFREEHHFEYLARLERPAGGTAPMKLWSSACSTGQEPYSIAMTLSDAKLGPYRLLASDLDTSVLRKAKAGVYRAEDLKGVSAERRRRWFIPGRGENAGQFLVHAELQRNMVFRQINLMQTWPIRGPLDAIFCRNVLIYFDRPTQTALINRFVELLAPGGHLFLGHSESVPNEPRLEAVGRTIYRRVGS